MLPLLHHTEDNSFGMSVDTPFSHHLPCVDIETELESHSLVLSQPASAVLKVG